MRVHFPGELFVFRSRTVVGSESWGGEPGVFSQKGRRFRGLLSRLRRGELHVGEAVLMIEPKRPRWKSSSIPEHFTPESFRLCLLCLYPRPK